MNTIFYFILAFIALIIIRIIMVYNQLIAEIEAVRNNNKEIDIQLDRRFKVLQSLIETVKKYMDYESSTLKEVVALRSKAETAKNTGDNQTRMDSENAISKIASGLNVVFEQYPELKANQNALQLQEEIVNTENRLAYAKQAYNDSIERYNADKQSLLFPMMLVGFFPNKLNIHFDYWGLSAEKIAEQENYTVKF